MVKAIAESSFRTCAGYRLPFSPQAYSNWIQFSLTSKIRPRRECCQPPASLLQSQRIQHRDAKLQLLVHATRNCACKIYPHRLVSLTPIWNVIERRNGKLISYRYNSTGKASTKEKKKDYRGSGHRLLYNLSRISRKDEERRTKRDTRIEKQNDEREKKTIKHYGNDSIFVYRKRW